LSALLQTLLLSLSLPLQQQRHLLTFPSYVGTLHEISSENSTVALEQVKSYGTEGRDPENEIPPSENVYEYIVFRGSDVKDLRIEKEPEKKPVQQPQVPDDPAILGVSPLFCYVVYTLRFCILLRHADLLDDEIFRM